MQFSFLTTNILILRSLLIVSAIFFILWGTITDFKYQVDTICFNALFILVNIYLSIPLLREVLPVNLTPLESEMYERDFKNNMTKRQFLHFFSHFKTEQVTANGSDIVKEGNPFSNVIYIAKMSPNASVHLSKNGDMIKYLTAGSWIGIIEYFNYQNNDVKTTLDLWDVSAKVEISKDPLNDEKKLQLTSGSGVIFYRFDLTVT